MSNFTIINKKLLLLSIILLNNKIAGNLGLSQLEDRQLADRTTNEEACPIPPYDDPLY
jgi:hypothetical protein